MWAPTPGPDEPKELVSTDSRRKSDQGPEDPSTVVEGAEDSRNTQHRDAHASRELSGRRHSPAVTRPKRRSRPWKSRTASNRCSRVKSGHSTGVT